MNTLTKSIKGGFNQADTEFTIEWSRGDFGIEIESVSVENKEGGLTDIMWIIENSIIVEWEDSIRKEEQISSNEAKVAYSILREDDES